MLEIAHRQLLSVLSLWLATCHDVTRDVYKLNFKNELCTYELTNYELTWFAERFTSKEYLVVWIPEYISIFILPHFLSTTSFIIPKLLFSFIALKLERIDVTILNNKWYCLRIFSHHWKQWTSSSLACTGLGNCLLLRNILTSFSCSSFSSSDMTLQTKVG